MSEFKQQHNSESETSPSFSIQGRLTPSDFTEEDLAFAQELSSFFSPEGEDLPPYYVQTLFDMEDQRLRQAEAGFEHKMSARVFRHLELRRRLFVRPTSLFSFITRNVRESLAQRFVVGGLAAFLLVMLLTVAFTGATFVSGVAVLLHGANAGGVYQTSSYPTGLVQMSDDLSGASASAIALPTAQQQMDFPIYWPRYMPTPYSLKNVNLYVGVDQQWANGPMLELEYSLPPSEIAPKGTGEIWVREFEPRADVLQLVNQGASLPINMDNSGRAKAIYVDGQWVPQGRAAPQWVFGERSELIYQINGVVFWIVGDQRDGVGEHQLTQIAQGLGVSLPHDQPFLSALFHPMRSHMVVTRLTEDIPGPFSTDVIVLLPANGDMGPYYISVSSYQPPKKGH